MSDKERIHRWITQADLERMLDDAFQRGANSRSQGHTWGTSHGVEHCQRCHVVRDRDTNVKPCRVPENGSTVEWTRRKQGDQRAVVGRAHCLVFASDERPGQWVWDIRFYDDYSTGYADSEEEAKIAAVNAVRAGVT
jgi:hypothetical protein